MRAAAREGNKPQPTAAPAAGQVLRTTRSLTIGDRVLARGAAVADVPMTAAARDRLLQLGALVWSAPSPSDAGRAPPRQLEPPEPSYPNPAAELLAEAVADAVSAHGDVVKQYQYAVAAVEALLHESVRYRAPDLLLTIHTGADLSARAHRDASHRFARDRHAPPGRRPHVPIPRLADEPPKAA
jgi:hypothetical protein